MKTIEIQKASNALADYAANLGSESILIMSRRKPVAALVPLNDAERECLSLGLNPAFMRIIRRARAEVKRGKVYSLKQVKQELLTEADASGMALHRTRPKAVRRSPA